MVAEKKEKAEKSLLSKDLLLALCLRINREMHELRRTDHKAYRKFYLELKETLGITQADIVIPDISNLHGTGQIREDTLVTAIHSELRRQINLIAFASGIIEIGECLPDTLKRSIHESTSALRLQKIDAQHKYRFKKDGSSKRQGVIDPLIFEGFLLSLLPHLHA